MSVGPLTHNDRLANTLLLVVLVFLGVSGIIMLYGTWLPWLFDLHRLVGFSLIALVPWKAATIYRSLRRGLTWNFDRSLVILISIVLAHFVLLVVLLGVMWLWRLGPYSTLLQTLLAWHWILGLALLPLLAIHVWRRWPKPRREDFLSRRGFLQMLGVAAAGVVGGGLATWLAQAQATEARPRRFTGSRGYGIFSGNDFPVIGESTIALDPEQWRLAVNGAVRSPLVLTYADLLEQPAETVTAIVDCTSGWFSVQDWRGVPLMRLLEAAGLPEGAAGVRLASVTGYNHAYPMQEARTILLATHVTGEVLDARHGFPVRAVVPGRRGWFWVKWLGEIEVLDSPWAVVADTLASPREVVRQWR